MRVAEKVATNQLPASQGSPHIGHLQDVPGSCPGPSYHEFLRQSEDGTIEDHRMRRLTFGISTSPYLATQVLLQVASDHSELYPEAARIVKSSFYVDNCLTEASTPELAIHLQQQLYEVLQWAGMKLRKWRSNSS